MLQDWGLEPETIPKNALRGEGPRGGEGGAWQRGGAPRCPGPGWRPAGKAARFSDVVHGTRQGAWVSCAEAPYDTCSDGEGPP